MEINYLNLYTSLVRIKGLLPQVDVEDDLDRKISVFRNAIYNKPDNPNDYLNDYYDGVSKGIYVLSKRIQSLVDDLKRLSSSNECFRGISNSELLNVMLLGETSAGKTTFLERIYGEDCGDTGPTPITAFTVVHDVTKAKSRLEVQFNDKFEISDAEKENFKNFMKKYGFYDDFVINRNVFSPKAEFAISDKSQFINFIREANAYPTAFSEIKWHHKESSKQIGFTGFARFYDMPGTGGCEEHTVNVDKSLEKYGKEIDVVLYLIKPDQGVPSSYEVLKSLKHQFDVCKINPKFCFVYQIQNEDEFQCKVGHLKEYVLKDSETDALNPFNPEERNYFLKAFVVDARGNKKQRSKADVALASILQKYMCDKALSFWESLDNGSAPKEFEILDTGQENCDDVNSHLSSFFTGIIDKIQRNNTNLLINEVKADFKHEFMLPGKKTDFSYLKRNDLKNTFICLLDEINHGIDSILDFLSKNKGGIFNKEKGTFVLP